MRRSELREDTLVFECDHCDHRLELPRCPSWTRHTGARCRLVADGEFCHLHARKSYPPGYVAPRRVGTRQQHAAAKRDKILAMRAEGKTYRQIAAEVRCSLSTVQSALYAAGVR